ncbi:hypothetical protein LTR10_019265 [Elasticomyces elasticus]|uniref:Ig-like domain-containing protein n=1 Tax=Exophiala sideris TaxID=1016849 RepID=A0ABR0IWV1_9EURO|nr:hypothetical protein LTR10_019265 [Elasticomyces elasticus]KAK5021943.1 hypothetical protein LTS07_010525 [Exophiala sideris]KAK5026006.1 hypothetical protein LTR13_010163 [Exophiala sideris]KAK5050693.1 hypothetical protein LTR69_010549 [Exophiala sideris]KAK5177178.1 hypothetical protein LTR44_010306 [Eurotiomycetes sp. CCFEE 6388]
MAHQTHHWQATSPVKRKPLPPDSRHNYAFANGSLQTDAYPVVPIHGSSSRSPPPDSSNIETGYEACRHQEVPNISPSQRDGIQQSLDTGSGYSRLSPDPARVYDSVPPKKNPSISNDEIPFGDDEQCSVRLWNPIWLHSLVLSAFIILFLALLVGLITLWHFVELENGINTDITNNHYAWTYGPTALLVVIGAAWEQVDFHCRTLAPWSHLRRGLAPARDSLLLDYVSPILPKVLTIAAANHDWAILASAIGVSLLKIVIIFSTGLLVLTPTPMSHSVSNAIVNSKFEGTNYTTGPLVIDTQLMRYYGIQQRGLEYQYGTTGTVAYDTLDFQSIVPNSVVTSTVNGVFPFFNCEIVEPEIVGDNFTWVNDGEDAYGDNGNQLHLTLSLRPTNCPPLSSYYSCQAPNCPDGQYISSYEVWNDPETYSEGKSQPLNDLDPCANLYQLSVTELNFQKVAGHPTNTSAAWNVTMPAAIAIICAPGYTIATVNVTVNTANRTASGGVNATGPLHRVADVLPGYSYYNLTQDLQDQSDGDNLPPQEKAPGIDGFAKLLVVLNGGDAATLLNTTVLKTTAEEAFKGMAVQLADTYLRKADNATTTAKVTYQANRLQIRPESVWGMATGFVLLMVYAAAILVWRVRSVVSGNPNSIGSHANILTASPTLQELLRGAGSDSASQLRGRLGHSMARSCVTNARGHPELCIEIVIPKGSVDTTPADSIDAAWWEPASITGWFMTLAIVLPIAIIVALEILQRHSNANGGLINMPSTSIVGQSLPSLFASAITTCMATLYGAIDSTAVTLAPYQTLAQGSASAKRTLLSTPLGNLPLQSTMKAIRNRQASAAVASTAAIIGGLLTIIASGLYTIENTPFAVAVNISTSDKFVPSFSTSTDGAAGAMLALIEQNNASYPALTYDGLAFPNLDLSMLGVEAAKQLNDPSQQVMLQANILAMRASLNCTLVPMDTMQTTTTTYSDPATGGPWCFGSQIAFNASLPPSCPNFLNGYNQTATNIPFIYSVTLPCGQTSSIFEQVVLNTEGAAVDALQEGPEGSALGAASNPPECPSLAFLSGHFIVNATSAENFTAVTCIQGLEQVATNTTFVISKDVIQVKSKPIVDESSTRWLVTFGSTYWFTSANTFEPFNGQIFDRGPDHFYSQVNYGPDGIPAKQLTGPSNTQRSIDATLRMYRRYMAQLINATMRQSLQDDEAASYSGTLLNINTPRLKQNATSKIVLQVFLGIMLVCGIFVYGRRNMHHILPQCPWSIAGTMSILADSEIIERKIIPSGSGLISDQALAKSFEGYMFSLGWWDTEDETSDSSLGRYGIDIGKADASTTAGLIQ